MTDSARRPLSVREVGELLAKSPHARDAILVGGQALNIWAVRYRLAAQNAAVSDDIDFFGNRAAAIAAGLDWDAEVQTPKLDDHTANSAIVLVDIDNVEYGIDFLNSILGVDSDELRRWSSVAGGLGYTFRVMHPLHVLQSQLENTYGLLNRRDTDLGGYQAERVKLAVAVVACAVREMLDAGKPRVALNMVKRIAAIATSGPALAAHARDLIDVLEAIPDHTAWSREFLEKRMPQIREAADRKRRRRESK